MLIIRNNTYWFVTQYTALLFLSPFLSKLALSLTKKNQLLLLVLFIINVSLNFRFSYGDIYSSPVNISYFILLHTYDCLIHLHNGRLNMENII